LALRQSGSAASAAELKKIQKYSDIIAGVDFKPVAIETSGVWGEAVRLILSRRSGVELQRSLMSHVRLFSSVNVCRLLCSEVTHTACWEHFEESPMSIMRSAFADIACSCTCLCLCVSVDIYVFVRFCYLALNLPFACCF
jgi:hypothetical protein